MGLQNRPCGLFVNCLLMYTNFNLCVWKVMSFFHLLKLKIRLSAHNNLLKYIDLYLTQFSEISWKCSFASFLYTLTFHSFKELFLLEIILFLHTSNLELLLSFHRASFLFYWANRFSWAFFFEMLSSSIISLQIAIINANLVFI